jgi:hypothetical protein
MTKPEVGGHTRNKKKAMTTPTLNHSHLFFVISGAWWCLLVLPRPGPLFDFFYKTRDYRRGTTVLTCVGAAT